MTTSPSVSRRPTSSIWRTVPSLQVTWYSTGPMGSTVLRAVSTSAAQLAMMTRRHSGSGYARTNQSSRVGTSRIVYPRTSENRRFTNSIRPRASAQAMGRGHTCRTVRSRSSLRRSASVARLCAVMSTSMHTKHLRSAFPGSRKIVDRTILVSPLGSSQVHSDGPCAVPVWPTS